MAYVIGIDFGTSSARALVARCADGREVGIAEAGYPSGEQGVLLDPRDPHVARQHPGDYLVVLEKTVREAIERARNHDRDFEPIRVAGVGVDTTGSSPLPVDRDNKPLALQEKWRTDLAAQCWLWKDHTSAEEAAEITRLARQHRPAYVAKCGNTYSSEWFWSKILHCLRTRPEVFAAAHSWVEIADWIPSVLAGVRRPEGVRRGICAAGHKALFHPSWGGLPDKEFLALLDPRLAELRDRLYDDAFDASHPAGTLDNEWATRLGLRAGIPVAMGAFDVHYGAIAAGVRQGVLVKVIGTSTCDCTVAPSSDATPDVPGICGIVPGAILPGFDGIEAGQSAVGDIFRWWVEGVCGGSAQQHAVLSEKAARLAPGESGLLALDWNNGNRTVLVDPLLSGLLVGQTLHTRAEEIYRALIEATAFGARVILERLAEYGVEVQRVVCAGGIADKNSLLMQIYADVLGREIQVARSNQTCALGAAMAAAVLAGRERGGHPSFEVAQEHMAGVRERIYRPEPQAQATYQALYALYRQLHDAFGGVMVVDLGSVMKDLLAIKERATAR